jgi:GNAT superfamily N-acetyltransferase
MRIRLATPDDVPALASLNDAYMRELFARPWNGTEERLAADLAEGVVHAALTETRDAFVAWHAAYDLHHCIRGASINDLYVAPSARGRGVAACLLAYCAARVAAAGGTYLHGTAAGERAAPLYARAAELHPQLGVIIGGRAFRAFAALDGAGPRAILSGLPPVAWNVEP